MSTKWLTANVQGFSGKQQIPNLVNDFEFVTQKGALTIKNSLKRVFVNKTKNEKFLILQNLCTKNNGYQNHINTKESGYVKVIPATTFSSSLRMPVVNGLCFPSFNGGLKVVHNKLCGVHWRTTYEMSTIKLNVLFQLLQKLFAL